MKIYLYILVLILGLGCNGDKSSSSNQEKPFKKFGAAFPNLELPYTVSDSAMKVATSNEPITRSAFLDYIPDTVLSRTFGSDTNVVLKPIGKIETKDKEDYLVMHAKGKRKSAIILMVFKDQKFSAAMPLLQTNEDDRLTTATIDKKLSININHEWNKNNQLMYARTIYAYNNAGVFTVVLTETNVPRVVTTTTILNPIDTFAVRFKYSGDYVKGKQNLVPIRDGAKPGEYKFFIHFMNDGDNPCGGDLKGELNMVSETAGIFTASGDPCVIDFKFSKNQVQVKEQGSCGNYRGITCFFNDTYTKRKPTKQPAKK